MQQDEAFNLPTPRAINQCLLWHLEVLEAAFLIFTNAFTGIHTIDKTLYIPVPVSLLE